MSVIAWIFRQLGVLRWLILWLVMPKYIVGVNGLIVNDQGEVWLQQHRFWEKQSWGLPGGMIHGNERPEDGLKREAREETGMDIKVGRILDASLYFRRGVMLVYEARFVGGEMKLDQTEIIQARFFKVDELPEQMLPQHRELVQRLLKIMNNES